MNEKEKAKELVDKYISYTMKYEEGSDMMFYKDLHSAKECALICVEEILKVCNYIEQCVGDFENDIEYFEQVKQEIINLR